MTPDELDAMVLSAARPQWRKVAFIVAIVGQSRPEDLDGKYDSIAERIVALVNDGKLESQGDLIQWRHSEVRLPQK
jgi:hypothetical protein